MFSNSTFSVRSEAVPLSKPNPHTLQSNGRAPADEFSLAYDIQYEPSELTLIAEFEFCETCLSETPGVHAKTCLSQATSNPTRYSKLVQDFIRVCVYRHSVPKYNGTPLADS